MGKQASLWIEKMLPQKIPPSFESPFSFLLILAAYCLKNLFNIRFLGRGCWLRMRQGLCGAGLFLKTLNYLFYYLSLIREEKFAWWPNQWKTMLENANPQNISWTTYTVLTNSIPPWTPIFSSKFVIIDSGARKVHHRSFLKRLLRPPPGQIHQ